LVLKFTLTGVVLSGRTLIFVEVPQFGILYSTDVVLSGRTLIFVEVPQFGILYSTGVVFSARTLIFVEVPQFGIFCLSYTGYHFTCKAICKGCKTKCPSIFQMLPII
jgi:hypothetical protein